MGKRWGGGPYTQAWGGSRGHARCCVSNADPSTPTPRALGGGATEGGGGAGGGAGSMARGRGSAGKDKRVEGLGRIANCSPHGVVSPGPQHDKATLFPLLSHDPG